MPDDDAAQPTELRKPEVEQIENRGVPRPVVVYEVIRREGETELCRPPQALAFSGLAAGLSMGFSFVGQAIMRAHLPAAPWQVLVSSLGYCVGFLIVILGRQQLFTENTLTPVLPLLYRPTRARFAKVARLWAIVLACNLLGTFVFAWLLAGTSVVAPPVQDALGAIARHAIEGDFWNLAVRGVFAGWLIALMVWLLPAAETARLWIIIIVTYVIGLGDFTHIVAGAVEVFYAAMLGAISWSHAIGGWFVPVLLGNLTGGLLLVAALNHAQVRAGGSRRSATPLD